MKPEQDSSEADPDLLTAIELYQRLCQLRWSQLRRTAFGRSRAFLENLYKPYTYRYIQGLIHEAKGHRLNLHTTLSHLKRLNHKLKCATTNSKNEKSPFKAA